MEGWRSEGGGREIRRDGNRGGGWKKIAINGRKNERRKGLREGNSEINR